MTSRFSIRLSSGAPSPSCRRGLGGEFGCLIAFENPPSQPFRNLRNYGVAESSKSVHPSGNPMSHSTHVGLRLPPPSASFTAWGSEGLPRAKYLGALLPSVAFGVGQVLAARLRGVPPWAYGRCLSAVSSDVGVGQSLYRLLGLALPRTTIRRSPRPPRSASDAFIVGNDEEAISPVRGTNGRSGKAVPLRVIPALGQVAENNVNSPSKECCHVLHEDVARSNQANEPDVLGPQPRSLPADPGTLAGVADVLAGESSGPDVEVIGDPRHAETEGDAPDAGEQVDLLVASEVIGRHLADVALVHVAWGQVPRRDLLAEDAAAVGVDLVVVGPHPISPPRPRRARRRRSSSSSLLWSPRPPPRPRAGAGDGRYAALRSPYWVSNSIASSPQKSSSVAQPCSTRAS
jgi:hypothetical protein